MAGSAALLDCPLCDFTVLPTDDYVLQLHFEQVHTTDSPFRIEDDPDLHPPPLPRRPASTLSANETQSTLSSDEGENSVLCPEPDCGELVLLNEYNDHLDYHAAETLSFDETTGKYHCRRVADMHGSKANAHHAGSTKSSFLEQNFGTEPPEGLRRPDNPGRKSKRKPQRGRSDTSCSEKSTLSRSIQTFNPFAKADKKVKPPSSSCRLGCAELGPHAWEDRMPRWLHDQLAAGPKITVVNRIGRDGRLIKQEHVQNETPGIIPILAQLSALDRTVKEAFYCHPSTIHISKTRKEGGFCGYRNIQMLISYIQGSRAQGHEEFSGRTPGVLNLQDLIEKAWDKGINNIGRQQTGGIRDTRKYIGTPEAQALFLSSQIDCAVQMFTDGPGGSTEAHESLLAAIERYFSQAAISDGSNVYKTLLPPIYLQQPGHSLTIVGIERRRDGSLNLMVLRQFPDLRYLYVFFRSRTLGFDVYPEDHFLRNFPWQQFGGLWIVEDARFARCENMNPLTAQALRRITSEGAPTGSSQNSNNSTASWSSGSSHQLAHPPAHDLTSPVPPRQISLMSSLDGTVPGLKGIPFGPESIDLAPVLDMLGMHTTTDIINPTTTQPHQAKLSLLTDVGRRYPGYPSALSPTFDAKQMFPSPVSESGTRTLSPQSSGRGLYTTSPISINEPQTYTPSHQYMSSGYGYYTAPEDNPEAKISPTLLFVSHVAESNKSPPRRLAPNRNAESHGRQTPPHQPYFTSPPHQHLPTLASSPSSTPPPSAFPIANGLETSTASPLSSSGTLLRYTSNRSVDSGLLAVRPLCESQVAEYRFWRPCGRRSCAFGCGGAREGETRAARRLFRSVQEVRDDGGETDGEEGHVYGVR
ncbi:hypothetical protein N0V90_001899 [Kalmusia sp. IMI 367209]|nr:hypothetical protein N0V90_001899 [Kalmusia sp. IMI 367209]